MTDIVIASAARTPVGSFNGAFGAVPAHDLGKARSRARSSAPRSSPRKSTKSSWARS
jgi:acetyl-CoA C-acetyltransferase